MSIGDLRRLMGKVQKDGMGLTQDEWDEELEGACKEIAESSELGGGTLTWPAVYGNLQKRHPEFWAFRDTLPKSTPHAPEPVVKRREDTPLRELVWDRIDGQVDGLVGPRINYTSAREYEVKRAAAYSEFIVKNELGGRLYALAEKFGPNETLTTLEKNAPGLAAQVRKLL